MIKVIIQKHNVELREDGHYFGTVYADKIESSIGHITKRPFIVVDSLTYLHPDEVEDKR